MGVPKICWDMGKGKYPWDKMKPHQRKAAIVGKSLFSRIYWRKNLNEGLKRNASKFQTSSRFFLVVPLQANLFLLVREVFGKVSRFRRVGRNDPLLGTSKLPSQIIRFPTRRTRWQFLHNSWRRRNGLHNSTHRILPVYPASKTIPGFIQLWVLFGHSFRKKSHNWLKVMLSVS